MSVKLYRKRKPRPVWFSYLWCV